MKRNNICLNDMLLSKRYNYFYNPHLCHICKIPYIYGTIECPSCIMISYCSEEDRLFHQPEHKDICEAIVKIRKQRNFYDSRGLTLKQWNNFKKANMESVRQELGRDFEPYEVQMFMWRKSCLTCRQQLNLSESCKKCFSVTMCPDHNSNSYEHDCLQLNICLKMNVSYAIGAEMIPIKIDRHINLNTIKDMPAFIQEIVGCDRNLETWNYNDFQNSIYFSQPLTFFYGLSKAQLLTLRDMTIGYFVIHIIAGAYVTNFLNWEVVLHKFCKRTRLVLVIIGPSVSNTCEFADVCNICKSRSMFLQYQCSSMWYYDYIDSSMYIQPNVIIGYHADFENKPILIQILKAMQRQSCPVLLTYKTKNEAQLHITKIREILDLPLTPILNENNKFASCRPFRSYYTDSVIYSNQHIIVYSDLINAKMLST